MSYDTSVCIDTGSGELHEIEEVGNMTSNVGAMFRDVLPGPYEGGGRYDGNGEPADMSGLPGLSGLRCSDALPLLNQAVVDMVSRRERLLTMEPANGWGTYDGALRYLKDCRDACERHPAATFCVNW